MDLPDLVLLKVFSFLNIEERFQTLRLVCRSWKQLVEYQIKVQKSAIVYNRHRPFHRRWPDDRALSSAETMDQSFFQFCLANDHYKQIKKLYLYRISGTSLESAGLMTTLTQCMLQLQVLSIDRSHLASYASAFEEKPFEREEISLHGLAFPNLRTLSVKQTFYEKVRITAPLLEKLIVWDFGVNEFLEEDNLMLVLSHPERLRYLQCDFITNEEIQKFTNLDALFVKYLKRDFNLSHCPKLRRLDLCLRIVLLRNRPDFVLDSIEGLLEQKKQLHRDHLKITNFGVRNESGNMFQSSLSATMHDDRFEFREDGLRHLLRKENYSKIAEFQLPWIGHLYYPTILQRAKRLASCCHMLNIQAVYVGSDESWKARTKPAPDPELLIKFLIEIGGVRYLKIGKYSFSQEFYDQLSTVPFITELIIIENALPPSNFKFICCIKFLAAIYIYNFRASIDSFQENVKKTKIRDFRIEIRTVFWFDRKENHYVLGYRTKKKIDSSRWKKIEFDNMEEAFEYLKKTKMVLKELV